MTLRYGYLLGLHILLLYAQGYNPTEIAAVLFCSRTSVYRTVTAYHAGLTALASLGRQPQVSSPPPSAVAQTTA